MSKEVEESTDGVCPNCGSEDTGVLKPLPDKEHCVRLCICGHHFEAKGEDVESDWVTLEV